MELSDREKIRRLKSRLAQVRAQSGAALRIAVASLYLQDVEEWDERLRDIVRELAPDVERVLRRDRRRAYLMTHPEDV